MRACATDRALIPAAAVDACTRQVLDPLTARLMTVDADGDVRPDLAESVEPSDAGRTWTVTLAAGRRFSDGTPVAAHNFVDAWNWSASCAQGYGQASRFADIVGYAAVHPDGPCPYVTRAVEPTPATAGDLPTMAGLTLVDDRTFRIELGRPIIDFDQRLAELAFAPLPDAFWVDPQRYAKVPIGAGPYRLVENNRLRHVVQTWDGYGGPLQPQSRTISFEVWNDPSLAFDAVVDGQLDVADTVPPETLGKPAWRSAVGGRGVAVTGPPGPRLTALVFAAGDPDFADPRRRRALSLAIDRGFVTGEVLGGAGQPAHGWVPLTMAGSARACGVTCDFAPGAAKDLWDAANAELGSTPATIAVTYARESGDGFWLSEVCATWRYTLQVRCELTAVPQQELTGVDTGVVVTHRAAEWDSPAAPLADYRTGSPTNLGRFSDAEYDAILRGADAATEPRAAWVAAQRRLAREMPSIPLWWDWSTAVWSDAVVVPASGFPQTFGGAADVIGLRR